jgi:hydrogenase expression/formation protein HypE
MSDSSSFTCPIPLGQTDRIQLGHGGGGTMMRRLLHELILPRLMKEPKTAETDSATLAFPSARLAFTSDAYVVTPRFFPGGDIGKLAIYGTVNDLAMAGATPRAFSVSLILEEGLELTELDTILTSMRTAADECAVAIVTGDTKVVERGKGDGVFIAVSGVGTLPEGVHLHPNQARPGDVILVSGDVGRHGIAVLGARNQFNFSTPVESDTASLFPAVRALIEGGIDVRFLRDITRGGLSSTLTELAEGCGLTLAIDENEVPVPSEVGHVCELLGLDPFHVACEGRMLLVVSANHQEHALEVLRTVPVSSGAALIGRVTAQRRPQVYLKTTLGTERLLYPPHGEQLPRIC